MTCPTYFTRYDYNSYTVSGLGYPPPPPGSGPSNGGPHGSGPSNGGPRTGPYMGAGLRQGGPSQQHRITPEFLQQAIAGAMRASNMNPLPTSGKYRNYAI